MTEARFSDEEIKKLYQGLSTEMTLIDCGRKCAPYNVGGKPFCCDILHAIPTVFNEEWAYLQKNTDLWFPWEWDRGRDDRDEARREYEELKAETPDKMVLLECLGPDKCEREFRSFTCRQFPFFPYLNSKGKLLGISYYEEYEESCWVISNLEQVLPEYVFSFVRTFDTIFERIPDEKNNYEYHSLMMRKSYKKRRRAMPLLHRNGLSYKISPGNERMRKVPASRFSKIGVYKIAAKMPFPDEMT